jgi:hypothetical protein
MIFREFLRLYLHGVFVEWWLQWVLRSMDGGLVFLMLNAGAGFLLLKSERNLLESCSSLSSNVLRE